MRRSDTKLAMNDDQAETIGLTALGFLAEDPARLAGFLSKTGIGPDDLRASAREPALLAGVLDFLRSDESMLLVFTSTARLNPESIERAYVRLSGQEQEYRSI